MHRYITPSLMHTPKTEQLTIQDYRKPEEEKLYYKATLDILKCSEEGTKCNFQGLLVVCDDIPRNVIYLDPSLRKRKASGAEGKVADVIFMDKKQVQSKQVSAGSSLRRSAPCGVRCTSLGNADKVKLASWTCSMYASWQCQIPCAMGSASRAIAS